MNKLEQQSPSLMNDEAKEDVIDLAKYFVVLKKRWLMITGFSFLTLLLAILVVFSITPVYRATAVLLLEAEQRNAVSIEDVYGVDTSKKEYFLTQFELLKSRSLALRVIEQHNLMDLAEFNGSDKSQSANPITYLTGSIKSWPLVQSLLPSKTEATEEQKLEVLKQTVLKNFQKKLTISPVRKTQLVKIHFESKDPKLAATLANAVGEAYINSHMEAHLQVSKQATDWLTGRIVKLKSAVTDSEQKLTAYLSTQGLIDLSGIDSLASSELTDLSRRLADARDRRVAAESIFHLLQENNNAGLAGLSSVSAISNHPQLRDIRIAEGEAERIVSELSKRYGPKHDAMIRAKAQLSSVQSNAEELLKELASGIEKELRSARKQESSLKKELAKKKLEFQSLAVKRATYDALKREVESNRKLYDLFVTRQKETTATGDFNAVVARFTDKALMPLKAAKPQKSKVVLLAAIAGFLLSIMLAFILDAMKNTIEKVADIEQRLGLLPLGAIPKINAKQYKKKDLDDALFFDKNEAQFTEAIRSIRTSLLLNMVNTGRKRICITSSIPGEGKTTMAINLAMSMASMEKVLLIDADLRKPSIAGRFGLNPLHPGLSNNQVMDTELSECVYLHKKSGLSILPAGMKTPNPQDLLASDGFAELLTQLEQKYDKIIIDTPPLLAVSDALLLSRLAGAAIIVAQAGTTKLKQLNHSLSKMIKYHIPIDGVVLNKTGAKHHEKHEYYGKYGEQYGEPN